MTVVEKVRKKKTRFTHKKGVKRNYERSSKPVGRPRLQHDANLDSEDLQISDDQQLLKLLWSNAYGDIMLEATSEDPEMHTSLVELLDKKSQAHAKSLKGDSLLRFLKKCQLTVSGCFATMMKAKSNRHKSLWLAARSISAYRQQLPTRWWNSERKQKLLLGRERTLNLIKTMSDSEPNPSFIVSKHVLELVYDQCHIWKGTMSNERWCCRQSDKMVPILTY